jgi:hypothetical protein
MEPLSDDEIAMYRPDLPIAVLQGVEVSWLTEASVAVARTPHALTDIALNVPEVCGRISRGVQSFGLLPAASCAIAQ